MTNDTVASGRSTAEPAVTQSESTDKPEGRRTAVGVLTALALSWLAAMLWVAHASVSSDAGVVALATAASSLPSVVSAALVAGAAAGLLAAGVPGSVRTGGWLSDSTGAHFLAALGAGALTGLIAGAAFVVGSGTDPARMVPASTLAVGATIGGAVAGTRIARLIPAVVAAGLATFLTGFVLGLVKTPIQDLYGASGGEAAQLSAAGWFAATSAITSGLAAGLTGYWMLGGTRRNPGVRWPGYLVAGAGSGLLLLVTELIVRIGGNSLLGMVRDISDADRALQTWAGGSRLNNALVVLFVGALVTLVALGRTLGSRPTAEPGSEEAGSEEAGSPNETDQKTQPGQPVPSATLDQDQTVANDDRKESRTAGMPAS